MTVEGGKVRFNKSKLIEKKALPALIRTIFKFISNHSESMDSHGNEELQSCFVICVVSIFSPF